MTRCMFVSDLHGRVDRYEKLLHAMAAERPEAVFLGGDLLPPAAQSGSNTAVATGDLLGDFLAPRLQSLRSEMGDEYPKVFLILGNDDPRSEEKAVIDRAATGVWIYAHNSRQSLGHYTVYGYSYVPPTPFMLKDWERYDVSRYVDPGCVPPSEGVLSHPVAGREREWSTIREDLEKLAGDAELNGAVFLFHAPPYKTALDRAALDGVEVDHVPVDVNVGSIAIERFIRARQPLLTLHGHVHESARLTGTWRERLGNTHAFSAAHDGPELALVRFELEQLEAATRELV